MADVEALELQITGDARSAEQSIDSLIETLGRLKTAASGGSGLRAVANPLQKISNAVNTLSGSGQKLKDLASGLTAVGKASNFTISTFSLKLKENSEFLEISLSVTSVSNIFFILNSPSKIN